MSQLLRTQVLDLAKALVWAVALALVVQALVQPLPRSMTGIDAMKHLLRDDQTRRDHPARREAQVHREVQALRGVLVLKTHLAVPRQRGEF